MVVVGAVVVVVVEGSVVVAQGMVVALGPAVVPAPVVTEVGSEVVVPASAHAETTAAGPSRQQMRRTRRNVRSR